MKRTLLFTVMAFAVTLSSCKKEDDTSKGPCQEEYETSYQDYKRIAFTINDSDTLYQNYGLQSYPANSPEPSDYLIKFQGTTVTMNLERIILDGDSCKFRRQHWVILKFVVNQASYESKEYIMGSPTSQTNYQNYAAYTGELDDLVRFSYGDNSGTVTVTKYIPQDKFEGYFDVNINGIITKGEFKIDLTKDY